MIVLYRLAGTLLATAALAFTAAADDGTPLPTTPGFKLLRDETLLTENREPMPAVSAKFGETEIVYEVTSLTDLQKAYGGEMATFNGENAGMSWLCYTLPEADGVPPQIVWFAADGVMSTNYGINFIVVEEAPEGATPTCAAPTKPAAFTMALPNVGSSAAQVATVFAVDALENGVMSFGGVVPLPPELNMPEGATSVVANFLVKNGIVTAVSTMQVSAN